MATQRCTRLILLALSLLQLGFLSSGNPLMKHHIETFPSSMQSPKHRRQQVAPVVVTGIQNGAIYPRLEIRQLQQNADQWNIYLLGLIRFQQTNQSQLTSWYQIAGIHGRPYIPWDGVPSAPGVNSPGYCNHVINTFLNWHRPYVALFEQTLYQNMVAAVNSFPAGPVRSRYAQAIATFRAPYWDWAAEPPAGQSVLPSFMQTNSIEVTTPAGNQTVHNPLFAYVFNPVSKTDFYFEPFASWNNTKRAPTSWDLNATSQNSQVASAMDNGRQNFQNRLYDLFVNYNNYTEFGNEAWISGSGVQNADSLESLHDTIHAFVGMNGDMTYFDYAAFDPSFFLHHAMVDRAFALWQVLYPDSYVEPMQAVEQTFTITVNETITVDSPLEPFYANTNGEFWTAASGQNISAFGYSYPELYPTVNVSAVKQAINQLYGSGSSGTTVSRRNADGVSTSESKASATRSQHVSRAVNNELLRQYTVNIRSPKTALNGSYAVYVFLGDYNAEPATWATEPNLVGAQAVFAGLATVDAPSNLQANGSTGILVSGSVPLTSKLQAKVQCGELTDMSPGTVEAYLAPNLHWRVATFHATEVAAEAVPGFQVTVASSEVRPASSPDEFPVLQSSTRLLNATCGKPGGAWED